MFFLIFPWTLALFSTYALLMFSTPMAPGLKYQLSLTHPSVKSLYHQLTSPFESASTTSVLYNSSSSSLKPANNVLNYLLFLFSITILHILHHILHDTPCTLCPKTYGKKERKREREYGGKKEGIMSKLWTSSYLHLLVQNSLFSINTPSYIK